MDTLNRPTVLVTGFGPFENHPVNASWEAVKKLPKEDIEKDLNVELVLTEISVVYENIDRFIPELWETYKPELVIHVGVSKEAKCLTIEKQAWRKNYQKPDILGQCPPNLVCKSDGSNVLKTCFDVENICKVVNGEKIAGVAAKESTDAGRFLCEYIYYKSLSMDASKVLFVHVPDQQVYPSDKTALGLKRIIELCCSQLKELHDNNSFDDGNSLEN